MHSSRRALFASCVAVPALCVMVASASAETLSDAIALAYETNPTLQAARAQLRGTDEEYVQAESGLRPTVNLNAAANYGNESTGALGPSISGANFGSASVTVQVNQPLYTGGRVSARIDAAKADILAGREGLRRTEISVLQSVVGAYLDVRRDVEQLAISQDNV